MQHSTAFHFLNKKIRKKTFFSYFYYKNLRSNIHNIINTISHHNPRKSRLTPIASISIILMMCCIITLHKLSYCTLFEDRVKSTHWSESMQSCETGSLYTKITDFFPLLSHSGRCFRCSVLHLHTS